MSRGTITGGGEDGKYTVELDRLDGADVTLSDCYCADLTEDLDGEVGLIEIAGDRSKGVNIQPGHDENAKYAAARDGALKAVQRFPRTKPTQEVFFNWAIRPWWQKYKPNFRYGTITHIYSGENTCDVTLEACYATDYPNGKQIDINQSSGLAAVPIEYMDCDSDAFEEDDEVLIQFDDFDWSKPKVIGFKTEPKPCSVHYFIVMIGNDNMLVWDIKNNTPAVIYRADGVTPISYPCIRTDADVMNWWDDDSENSDSEWTELFTVDKCGDYEADESDWDVQTHVYDEHTGEYHATMENSDSDSPFGGNDVTLDAMTYKKSRRETIGSTRYDYLERHSTSEMLKHYGTILTAANGSSEVISHWTSQIEKTESRYLVSETEYRVVPISESTRDVDMRDMAKSDIDATVVSSPYFPDIEDENYHIIDELDFHPVQLGISHTDLTSGNIEVYWPYGSNYANYEQAHAVITEYRHAYFWWDVATQSYGMNNVMTYNLSIRDFYNHETLDRDGNDLNLPPLLTWDSDDNLLYPEKSTVHNPYHIPIPKLDNDGMRFHAYYRTDTKAIVQIFMRRKFEDDLPPADTEMEAYATCDYDLENVEVAPSTLAQQASLETWLETIMNENNEYNYPYFIENIEFRKAK